MNDKRIKEKDRIYSPNKKYWCKKTTKKGANRLFKVLDGMNKRIKTRGVSLITPPKEDRYIDGKLKIIRTDKSLDIYYLWNPKTHEYDMFTDALRYGNHLEIIGKFGANDEEQMFLVNHFIKSFNKKQLEEKAKID